jgi:hypothetical protein
LRCACPCGPRPVERGRGVEADGALRACESRRDRPDVSRGIPAAGCLWAVPGPAMGGWFGRDHVEMIDTTELYRYVLGIEAPWEVTGIELSEHEAGSMCRWGIGAARGLPARSAEPYSRCMTIPRIVPGVIWIVAGA